VVALMKIKVAIATMLLFLTVAIVNVRVEATSQIMLRLDPVGYVAESDIDFGYFWTSTKYVDIPAGAQNALIYIPENENYDTFRLYYFNRLSSGLVKPGWITALVFDHPSYPTFVKPDESPTIDKTPDVDTLLWFILFSERGDSLLEDPTGYTLIDLTYHTDVINATRLCLIICIRALGDNDIITVSEEVFEKIDNVAWIKFDVEPGDPGVPDMYSVNYYVNDVVVKSAIFAEKPPSYTPPLRPGYKLLRWTLADGSTYSFTPVTTDMLVNNTLNLYAVIDRDPDYVPGPTDPPVSNLPDTIKSILAGVGLDDAWGYVTLYVITSLLIIAGLVALRLNPVAIAIVQIVVTGLFFWLGMLPWWVLIITGVALALMFFSIRRSVHE
jgi:hypothetical protein